ncbi:MAG: Hint domain-containing protein [Pseudomonadota bacterium]
MPNVTIPTTSQTESIDGDNGITTNVTFSANDLTGAFWGRTGVGLAGSNYDPSGEAALDVAFSNAVEDVQFTLFDVDQATGAWDDQIRVEAYDLDGNPIPITFTTTGTGHVVEEDGTNGVLQIEASNNTGDNQSSIVVSIAGPVGSFRVFYEDGTTDTNNSGVINIESLSFTDAVIAPGDPGDGTVEGTSGNDVIDSSYTGDPEGDLVDNNDALLPGDTGDDDLIYGFDGNDSITAGAGADEIYGGTGTDTIDGGADADLIFGGSENDSILAGSGNDEVYGGSGADSIDGGANDDLLVGDQTPDAGGDTIVGGTGNDTIYGDSIAATPGASTFSWASLNIADNADVSGGISGTSADGNVTVSLSVAEETNFTSATMDVSDPLYDYNGVSDQSSIELLGGSAGTSADAATATLDFSASSPGIGDEVENVTFGIFDLDELDGQFLDQVIIRAYDADGNLVPVTLTAGDATTITTSVDGSGVGTATSIVNSGGGGSTSSQSGFVQVDVAGPVARIEIDYNNVDPVAGNHAIRIGDLSFTSTAGEVAGGDDSLEGGLGDDTIFGQTGDDTIGLSDNFGDDVIEGGEDTDLLDVDVIDGAPLTQNVTVDYSAAETGTITNGVDTASYAEIEEIITGSGDDTVLGDVGNDTVSTGAGVDTLSGGAGNDVFDAGADNDTIDGGIGDDSIIAGTGDDTISLSASFGNDTIAGGEDAGNGDVDVLDSSAVTTNTTVDFSGAEAGTVSAGGDTATFSEIEQIVTGAGDDTVLGDSGNDNVSTGAGADTISGGGGDDTFDAGSGDDTIDGGTGDDSINAGIGSDTIELSDNFGNDTVVAGEDVGDTETDILDASGVTTDVTLDISTPETGTLSSGGDTASFSEVEEFVLGSGDDSVTGSSGDDIIDLGQGADTIEAGAGNDTINLGEDSPGNPDQDPDVVVLDDGFGNDVITNFDAPTDNGDGTFTGIDKLDVSDLTDLVGDRVNTNDVTVDNDGSGNALLTFPNGETIVLDGISPTDADNPFYLSAIGIPMPDGIVSGTEGSDTINAGYTGDPDGDLVDAGDELVAGEGTDDDIIVAMGGDDSIAAGAGNDEIFGGDGADSIDAGAGNDTVYGDTPDGAWHYELYGIPASTDAGNLEEAGFINSEPDFNGVPEAYGYTDSLDPNLIDTGDEFALKYTATVQVDTAGNYTFATTSNDGSKLFINGVEIVNNDGEHAPTTVTGTPVALPAGEHLIEIIYFENVGTSALSATISGPDTGNTPTALATYDGLRAATGDDTIAASAGDDTVFGGGGDDAVLVGETDDTDTITGGEDIGGTDIDTVSFDPVSTSDGVDVSFTGDEAADYQVGTSGSDGSFSEIERVVGTDNADTIDLSGDSAGITVEGGAGDDTVTSGQGDDTVLGGTGDDTVNIDQTDGTDAITGGEDGSGTDIDTVNFGDVSNTDAVNVTFTGDEEANYQVGTTGSDGTFAEIERVVGTANDDTFDLSGDSDGITVVAGTGDDTITSGQGDDTVEGGTGDDIFTVDQNDGTDTFTGGEDGDGSDIDTVSFDDMTNTDGVSVSFSGDEEGSYQVGAAGSDGTFAEVERIVGTDNADTINLTGDTAGITVESGAGDDVVTSGAGDDSINTGTGQDDIVINDDFGNDAVDGGTGADGTGDVLDGSALTQNVVIDFSAAETGTVSNGVDTLSFAEIEEIVTGSGDDTVLGDAGNDVVSTGAGVDTISGGAGDDTFDAGAGADTIAGGIGDDSITASTGDDTIVIEDTFGDDTIDGGSDVGNGDTDVLDGSALTEDVVVDLTGPETGTISNGTDTASFAEIEEIVTGSGDDTVTGGAGSDTVSTGAGEDEVTFSGGDDIDTGTDDDVLILTGDETGDITIDGGDEVRDGGGNLVGTGDTLELGTFADLSTLNTTTAPDGSLSGTVTLDNGSTLTFTDIERIICFTPGTTIATPLGARPIESLQVGDLVVTRDHGLQPIRWIESRTVEATGTFAPVRIRPGAVTGLERDLLVSPQHRMLFTGYRAELLFGEREVLMPAIHLVDGTRVTRESGGEVTYIHMMFDQHEVIFADGAASESFHPGDQALAGITDHAREELFALFPELRSNPMGYGTTARRCLKKHETQMLQVV